MNLIPIYPDADRNAHLIRRPDCPDNLSSIIDYYKVIGFNTPWICYYAEVDGSIVGGCAFKGAPKENKVELAYETFPAFQKQGFAFEMCVKLIDLAREKAPTVLISARTLPDDNFSTRVLKKAGFRNEGIVIDPDDEKVWEWILPNAVHRG